MHLRLFVLFATTLAFGLGVTTIGFRRDDQRDVPAPTAARRSATGTQVQLLEQQVRDRPLDTEILAQLAGAYLQRARESADPAFYTLADRAVARALELDANDPQALTVAGGLALARHDFAAALVLGGRARAVAPGLVASRAVIVDALVELGRYDEGITAAQELVDLRPDFRSYSRVSYIRELHGDLPGAIEAMQQAVMAGAGVPQDAVWGLVLLGNLELQEGDIDAAATSYQRAASLLPEDANAHYGLARLTIARNDPAAAADQLRAALERAPTAERAILLGDLLASQGRVAEAEEQYALVRVIQQLFADNGGDADLELALFEADHGDSDAAYAAASAAYARRPSILAADALAWAAYRNGRIDEARERSAEALRLGTRDARLAYHAGVIALAVADSKGARQYLQAALISSGALSPVEAVAAHDALTRLPLAFAASP